MLDALTKMPRARGRCALAQPCLVRSATNVGLCGENATLIENGQAKAVPDYRPPAFDDTVAEFATDARWERTEFKSRVVARSVLRVLIGEPHSS